MYYIRNKEGYLTAECSEEVAFKIFNNVKGEFKTLHFKDGPKTCYVVSEDMFFGSDRELKVCLFEGSYLSKML